MSINQEIKKRMIDKDIKGAKQLSEASGVSYERCLRLLRGDKSVKLKDAVEVAECLGASVKFVIEGE